MAVARSRGPWRRRLVLVLTAGLALSLIAGCSSSATHARSLPPLPRASASLTTDVGPQETVQGMEAFVRDFYAEIGTAAATGNITRLEEMMAAACGCQALARSIFDLARQGRIEGFRYTILSLQGAGVEEGTGNVFVIYALPQVRVIAPSGRVVATELPVDRGTESVTTSWLEHDWQITGIARIS